MWFLIQIFNGTASLGTTAAETGVAWWAHIGGFLFGWLVAKFTQPKRNFQNRTETIFYPDEIYYR
jgi:membrane associated rhomboid family serine protease